MSKDEANQPDEEKKKIANIAKAPDLSVIVPVLPTFLAKSISKSTLKLTFIQRCVDPAVFVSSHYNGSPKLTAAVPLKHRKKSLQKRVDENDWPRRYHGKGELQRIDLTANKCGPFQLRVNDGPYEKQPRKTKPLKVPDKDATGQALRRKVEELNNLPHDDRVQWEGEHDRLFGDVRGFCFTSSLEVPIVTKTIWTVFPFTISEHSVTIELSSFTPEDHPITFDFNGSPNPLHTSNSGSGSSTGTSHAAAEKRSVQSKVTFYPSLAMTTEQCGKIFSVAQKKEQKNNNEAGTVNRRGDTDDDDFSDDDDDAPTADSLVVQQAEDDKQLKRRCTWWKSWLCCGDNESVSEAKALRNLFWLNSDSHLLSARPEMWYEKEYKQDVDLVYYPRVRIVWYSSAGVADTFLNALVPLLILAMQAAVTYYLYAATSDAFTASIFSIVTASFALLPAIYRATTGSNPDAIVHLADVNSSKSSSAADADTVRGILGRGGVVKLPIAEVGVDLGRLMIAALSIGLLLLLIPTTAARFAGIIIVWSTILLPLLSCVVYMRVVSKIRRLLQHDRHPKSGEDENAKPITELVSHYWYVDTDKLRVRPDLRSWKVNLLLPPLPPTVTSRSANNSDNKGSIDSSPIRPSSTSSDDSRV